MDYHRYGSLGVGAVPPLLNATGLPEHAVPASASQAIPGPPQSILSHHHHPSLMFHYGVGNKPLPPHLGPPVPSVSNNVISSCNTTASTANMSLTASTKLNSSVRTTATVPPLGLGQSVPLTTTAGVGRPQSPGSSSFAAALRSLAKQATTPLGPENEGYPERAVQSSPKVSSMASSNNHSLPLNAPPVVAIAPTHSHSISDLRKDAPTSEVECLATSEDLMRGFQPYRAPDLPVSSAGQLRPSLPMDLGHYYASLYPHHLGHQYRLEEQLYLERYGLMRPPMPPYGIGGLSSLYSTSPYLSTRFPPEFLPTSLSALHPSNALLHERLKLEEDIRQKEYELELRRERELEREKERERNRERDRRHKEYENEKNREERHKEALRARSPLINSWSSPGSSISTSNVTFPKKSPINLPPQQLVKPLDTRPPKFAVDSIANSSSTLDCNKREKQRIPAIVRPFETCPTVYNVDKESEKKLANGSEQPKPFSVWQPVQLPSSEETQSIDLTVSPGPTVVTNGQSSPLNPVKPENTEHPKTPSPVPEVAEKEPDVEVVPYVSRLDMEEKRMKELKDCGHTEEEIEEMLWEESTTKSWTLLELPTLSLDVSEEKLSFLEKFNLVTHEKANYAKFERYERRSKTLNPLTEAQFDSDSPEMCQSGTDLASLIAPGRHFSESPKMKGSNSLLSDFPRKSRFLNELGLVPQYSKVKQKFIDNVWQTVLKDRLQHYKNRGDRSSNELHECLELLLSKDPIIETMPSLPLTHKITSMESILDASSQEVLNADEATQAAMESLQTSITSTSRNKAQNSLLETNDKKLLEDQLLEVQNLISGKQDSNLQSQIGIDKLMEHLVKNSQSGENAGSSTLLKNMEDVRRYQLLVCQTAQMVQDQVSKLISTRAQLENHRSSLHSALSSISNILRPEQNGHTSTPEPCQPSQPNQSVRQSFNISSLTATSSSPPKTASTVLSWASTTVSSPNDKKLYLPKEKMKSKPDKPIRIPHKNRPYAEKINGTRCPGPAVSKIPKITSPLSSSHLYYVSTPRPLIPTSVISHGSNKSPLSFTPYAKNSSKIPSWLPNN